MWEASSATEVKNLLFCKTDLAHWLDLCFNFLRQALYTWAKFHRAEPLTMEGVQEEILFSNNFINICNKVANGTR